MDPTNPKAELNPSYLEPTRTKRPLGNRIAATIGLAMLATVAFFFLKDLVHVFQSARIAAERTKTAQNLKSIGKAANLYVAENNDRFPPADRWADLIRPFAIETDIFDPTPNHRSPSYAYNQAMSSIKETEIEYPSSVPLVFESTLAGPTSVGGLSDAYRDIDGNTYSCSSDSSTGRKNPDIWLWNPRETPPPRRQ
jgi:hypothetical protein